MQIQTALLCDAAGIYNNQLSILGTFSVLEAHTFPFAKTHCALAIQIGWSKSEEGQHSVKVTFMNEDGKPMLNEMVSTLNVLLPEKHEISSSINVINIEQLTFQKSGMYQASVFVDGEVLSEIQLQVVDVSEG